MPEVRNNTIHTVTFHHGVNSKTPIFIKIHPQGSEEIPSKLWNKFKKNKVVKKMLEEKKITVIEEPKQSLIKRFLTAIKVIK